MTRDEIVQKLLELGVPLDVVVDFPGLPTNAYGLLIYGSRARGDAVAGSDLDLLALADARHPSMHAGDVNVSYYTRQQLETGIGTLFGAHLRRDSKIIWDPSGDLGAAIDAMGDVDTAYLLARVWRMSTLFTSLDFDLPRYLDGLLREARYLLRSCLYAQAIASGQPCFSVRELSARHGDPALVQLLASRHEEAPSSAELAQCLSRLELQIGAFPLSQHGSLEATIVNEWDRPGDLLSMAFLALGTVGRDFEYAEVEKILL